MLPTDYEHYDGASLDDNFLKVITKVKGNKDKFG